MPKDLRLCEAILQVRLSVYGRNDVKDLNIQKIILFTVYIFCRSCKLYIYNSRGRTGIWYNTQDCVILLAPLFGVRVRVTRLACTSWTCREGIEKWWGAGCGRGWQWLRFVKSFSHSKHKQTNKILKWHVLYLISEDIFYDSISEVCEKKILSVGGLALDFVQGPKREASKLLECS